MNITSDLFEAYLKCPSKCFLRSRDTGSENECANWVQAQNEAYRSVGIKRLTDRTPQHERAISAPEHLKSAKWTLAVDPTIRAKNIESNIHALERVPSEIRGKPAQFTPIRFAFTNKLSRHDKLLLAFDGLVLSETLGREVDHGKIIHGEVPSTLTVKTGALASEVRKITA